MTVTVAILKPVPQHDIDETECEFDLTDEQVAFIDAFVGTPLGTDRAEVIQSIIVHQLRRYQAMGLPAGYRVGDAHPNQGSSNETH